MAVVESLFLQATGTSILLGGVLMVIIYFYLSSSGIKEEANEPPGPKPLPLLGNLLQLDLDRPHESLYEVRVSSFTKVYQAGLHTLNVLNKP